MSVVGTVERSRSMNPSKQPPGAVQVSDAWPVAKAATLRVTRQDARSASDGASAGGEACVRIMHRRLMAAVPADSAVRRSEKSGVAPSVRDRREIRRRGNGVRWHSGCNAHAAVLGPDDRPNKPSNLHCSRRCGVSQSLRHRRGPTARP